MLVFMSDDWLFYFASDESPKLKHNEPGLLSMPVALRDSLGSQFIITFEANHSLDRFFLFFYFFYLHPVSVFLYA